jgi:hypothetical protein
MTCQGEQSTDDEGRTLFTLFTRGMKRFEYQKAL